MPLDTEPTDIDTPDTTSDLPTPLKAARKHCLDCCRGSAQEVRLCTARECPLYLYRHGRRPTAEEIAAVAHVPLFPEERPISAAEFHANGGTALKAIRRRCLDCSGYSQQEVQDCWAKPGERNACDLYPYRLGKNPNRAGKGGNPAAIEALRRYREQQRGSA